MDEVVAVCVYLDVAVDCRCVNWMWMYVVMRSVDEVVAACM